MEMCLERILQAMHLPEPWNNLKRSNGQGNRSGQGMDVDGDLSSQVSVELCLHLWMYCPTQGDQPPGEQGIDHPSIGCHQHSTRDEQIVQPLHGENTGLKRPRLETRPLWQKGFECFNGGPKVVRRVRADCPSRHLWFPIFRDPSTPRPN